MSKHCSPVYLILPPPLPSSKALHQMTRVPHPRLHPKRLWTSAPPQVWSHWQISPRHQFSKLPSRSWLQLRSQRPPSKVWDSRECRHWKLSIARLHNPLPHLPSSPPSRSMSLPFPPSDHGSPFTLPLRSTAWRRLRPSRSSGLCAKQQLTSSVKSGHRIPPLQIRAVCLPYSDLVAVQFLLPLLPPLSHYLPLPLFKGQRPRQSH